MFNAAGKTLTIFVVLIIILLLSSTSIGFYLYHLEERLHKNVETQLDISRANEQKLQSQLKDTQGQLALSEDKNKEADQKINNLLDEQDLNEGLRAALKKENAELKEQMANIEASKEKIKTDLDDNINKLSQSQELLKASEDKSKDLETRFAALVETNKNDEEKIKELTTGGGPMTGQAAASGPGGSNMDLGKIVVNPSGGPKGHILSIDTDAEFVIFSLGLDQGIKPDDILSVFRGDKYLGDIKASRVQDEMSAADIIPPLTSKEVLKNDTVVLKP